MAEETQSDLSMEDILSSIKDILSNDDSQEDETVSISALTAQEAEPAVETVVEEVEDDVFDLSADMMIDDAEFSDETETAGTLSLSKDTSGREIPEIIAEPILDDADKSSDILSLPEIKEDIAPEIINETPVEDNTPYVEDVIETVSEVLPDPEEEIFDALPDPEIPSLDDLIADDVAVEAEAEVEAVTEVEPEENIIMPDVDSEPIFSVEEERTPLEAEVSEIKELMDNQAALNQESEAKQEENQKEIQSGEIDEVLSAASELIEANAAEDTSAVDASANIISNFAKMFAAKSDKTSEEKETAAPVIPLAPLSVNDGLGNVSKTLEDLIKDTIRQMIGAAVMEKFSENTDINKYAQEEIKVQTKIWLDKNLPAVVEAAVQKEIERVMAKVGS